MKRIDTTTLALSVALTIVLIYASNNVTSVRRAIG